MRRRHLHIQNSPRDSCEALAKFYLDNPGPSVFPRPVQDLLGACDNEGLVHAEMDGQIRGVAGIFDSNDRIHEIGGVLVTLNGFRLQRILMATLAVMVPLSNEDYDQVTAAVFDDNLQSIANLRTQFDVWRSAPERLMAEKAKKADGRGFRLYHASRYRLVQMAQQVLALEKDPVLRSAQGEVIELVLDHPLYTDYLPSVAAFIAEETQRLEEEGAGLP